jgi:tRNA/rRNA methyltransferase
MASGAAGCWTTSGLSGTGRPRSGDCSFVYATTARPRDLTKLVFSPEERRATWRGGSPGRARGLPFGPELTGLDNDDVAR